jgi:hypothetical protein
MAALLILAFFAALSVLVLTGHSADSRDPDFSLGKVAAPRRAPKQGV